MTETSWSSLRQLLADRYDDFCNRLARRLGSKELARETLHETWLHLDRKDAVGRIHSPAGYLLRTALNLAIDRGHRERRRAPASEIKALLDVADDAPDPEREVDARLEMAALERAVEELSPRRRTILLASRLQELPLREIAERLGVSQRLVEIELKHALAHCAQRLGRTVTRRFGPNPIKTSLDGEHHDDIAKEGVKDGTNDRVNDRTPPPPSKPIANDDPS